MNGAETDAGGSHTNPALYRFAFEHAVSGMALFSSRGLLLDVNRRFAELIGLSAEALFRSSLSSFLVREDLPPFYRALRRLKRLGGMEEGEFRLRHTGGSFLWLQWRVTSTGLKDEGDPVLLLDVQDITSYKKMERTNFESEQRYSSLIEYNPAVILSLDLQGEVVGANPAAEKAIGYSEQELLGRSFKTLIKQEEGELRLSHYRNGFVNETFNNLISVCHKEGHILEWGAKDVPIYVNDKIVGFYIIAKDITDQRKDQQSLRKAEQELKDAVRQQQGLTYKFKAAGGRLVLTLCDGELLYRMGLTPEAVVGRPLQEVLDWQGEEREEAFRRALAGEENVQFEGRYAEIDYLASLRPLKEGDAVKEVIVSCVDITERKWIARKLSESEQRYRSLFHYNPDAVVFTDRSGHFISLNPVNELITGYKPEELVHQTLLTQMEEEDQQAGIEFFTRTLGGEPQNGELRIRHKNGHPIHAHVTYIPTIVNQEVVGVYSIIKDISAQKKMQEELRSTKELLESFVENIDEAICLLDLDRTIIQINRAFERIYGWAKEEAEGMRLPVIPPGQDDEFRETLTRVISGEPVVGRETVRTHRSGHLLTVSETVSPIHDAQGKIVAFASLSRDITEHKRTDELLRKSDKLSVVGQLAAGVAHEIRNPLTSLKGFLQLLRGSAKENQNYYDIMLSELERINVIVNEFLFLAKPQISGSGKNDVCHLLKDVITLLDTQAILSNIEIRFQPEGAAWVQCEENKLKQVFINILKNSMEAMPAGGVIRVEVTRPDSRQIRIRVEDEGEGIPGERLPKLGEPFYTTKEKGTGLGLMMCFKIIEAHKGRITISSSLGAGTIVDVYLPA
ncbi:PAS domain S-box protein [Paenibacillus aurantius]|uniref:histidine kinase n=1 Tax=Paenibacillus aurantius TaxID=2918900 RepID=A0AA96LAA6_9BACL|nr:PAS domain S-box protein [Paenibacillus aurantius]WNQ09443.1 PAS domain S-box protein [Paenibacillus aurantius]